MISRAFVPNFSMPKPLPFRVTSPSVVTAHVQTCHKVNPALLLLLFTVKLWSFLCRYDTAASSPRIEDLPECELGRVPEIPFVARVPTLDTDLHIWCRAGRANGVQLMI